MLSLTGMTHSENAVGFTAVQRLLYWNIFRWKKKMHSLGWFSPSDVVFNIDATLYREQSWEQLEDLFLQHTLLILDNRTNHK